MSKYCGVCGCECEDKALFCTNCGFRFDDAGRVEAENNKMNIAPKAAGMRHGCISKKLLIPIIAATAAVIIIIIAVAASKAAKTVNLTDFAEVTIEGPDGYASASANIKKDELELAVLNAMGYKGDSLTQIYLENKAEHYIDLNRAENIVNDVRISLDKYAGIKNGDKITARITYSGSLDETVGIEVKDGKASVKAADLAEVAVLNPFEMVKVVFSGIDGYGTAEITNSKNDYGLSFKLDKTSGLSNGDTVKVTISYNYSELLSKGFTLSDSAKSYTVSGLTEAEEVDLFDALTVTFSGTEHYGKVNIEDSSAYMNYFVTYSADKTTGLSNGDKVTITAYYDEEVLKTIGLKPLSGTKEYIVEGLGEAQAIDVFEKANVYFGGTSPFAYAKAESYTDDNGVTFSFSFDKAENLSVGDKVTVTANFDEELLLAEGYKALSLTKEYTVEGVDAYATSDDMLDETIFNEIKKKCSSLLKEHLDEDMSIKHSESFFGIYIFTAKPEKKGYNGVDNEKIYLIYKGTVEREGSYEETEVFYVFKVTGVMTMANGTHTYDAGSIRMLNISSNLFRDVYITNRYIFAYTSGYEMFNECIVNQKNTYNYYVSDALKTYGV